jgi:hypothetical protein
MTAAELTMAKRWYIVHTYSGFEGKVFYVWFDAPIAYIAATQEWAEHNGPPVAPPTREGFGSRLLNKVLPMQADVFVKMNFAPTGLRASISLPPRTAAIG